MNFLLIFSLVGQVVSIQDSLLVSARRLIRNGDTTSALRMVEEFVEEKSDPEAYRKAALFLRSSGLKDKAYALLEKGRKRLGRDYLFAREFYIYALEKRDYESALREAMNRLLEGEDPGRVKREVLMVSRYLGKDRAIDLVRKWMKKHRKFSRAHAVLAELYLSVGRIAEAAREFELAGEGRANISLAREALQMGEPSVAMSILRGFEEKERDARWEFLMGRCFAELGEYEKAVEHLEKAEEAGVRGARELIMDIYLGRLNRPDLVLKATSSEGFDPVRIKALIRMGKAEKALEECSKCDTTQDGLYYCGLASLINGDFARADSFFNALLSRYIAGERVDDVFYFKEILMSGAEGEARKYFEALGYLLSGDVERAAGIARENYGMGGSLKPYFGYLWGNVLEKEGKWGEAFSLYREIYSKFPGYIAGECALRAYDIASKRLNDPALAKEVLREFILKYPDSSFSEYFRTLL